MNRTLLALELKDAYLLNSRGETVAETYSTPAALINTLLPNIFTIAGLVLFVFIIGAGLKIVMNPGDSKAVGEGQKAISYAIGGFLLLLASYWVIQIIQYVTGVPILGN